MISTVQELRLDRTREIPVFLGDRGDAVFACLHLPEWPSVCLVLICSSIGAEFKYNYRREVLLARLLARKGMAVVRFHYLGLGNSDDGAASFERMVRDTQVVQRWAQDLSGAKKSLFFGAKFGALVAAAAGRDTRSPVVVWGAPSTGAEYFRDIFRVGQVGRLVQGNSAPDMANVHVGALLEAGDMVDVVGYAISAALYNSALHLSFEDELGPEPRDVLLVEVAVGEAANRALIQRGQRLAERGFQVSTAWLQQDHSWWLHSADWRPEEERSVVRRLLQDTATWLLARQSAGPT